MTAAAPARALAPNLPIVAGIDPGPFLEIMLPDVRQKILSYLDFQDILTLRGVSISTRALIDHTYGLNVIANDNFPKNAHFVRRVTVIGLRIDHIRKDYSKMVRTYVKNPSQTRELNIQCALPRPVLAENLRLLNRLTRIGFKDQALTSLDFFPVANEDEHAAAALALPFRNLQEISLEVNFKEWTEDQPSILIKNRAWSNMIGFLERVQVQAPGSLPLNKLHFEFTDWTWSADEAPLVRFLERHSVSLRDLSVKLNFNRSSIYVVKQFDMPDMLTKLRLHLGTFSYKIMDNIADEDINEKVGYGLFWTKLINFQQRLEVMDASFRNQPFNLGQRLASDDFATLKVLKLHDLSFYNEVTTRSEHIDLENLAMFFRLEELHLHHAIFNDLPKRVKIPNQPVNLYKKRVKNLVRAAEATHSSTLASLRNVKKVALWGILMSTVELLQLLDIPKLEQLDIRGCGIRGRYGIGNAFFERMDLAKMLPKYLGVKNIRIEDLNNDEIHDVTGYYQGYFAQLNGVPVTGQFMPKNNGAPLVA